MATIPETLGGVLLWCRARFGVWGEDPQAIGLDQATVDELDQLLDEADQAREAAAQARAAARAAGDAYRMKHRALRERAATAVRRVRAHADTQTDPEAVLADALLDARKTPEPTPAPSTPERFEARLRADGALACAFACRHDRRLRGVTYVVERDVCGCGAEQEGFTYVATIGRRAFVDRTLPVGATVATYRITARTSTRSGDAAEFNVRFGAADASGAGASKIRAA